MAVDQRKIDKMSSERVTPGNELGDLTEVQNQVNAVNAERMNNLAQERIESQSVQETNTNLRTAVEIATDDSGNVVQQPQRTLPASSGNLRPETRALLANYGVNPNITETNNRKSTTNSSRNSTSRTSPGTGNVSNVTNINNVTNNTTNTETKVEIRKGGIETSTPQIPISVPQPQETNTAKFKAWLQNVFSKQNERYEINRREYDKKEYSLRRTSEKLMKKFGEVSKSVANRLDPSNMGKTFGSQMKVFVVLLGAMLLTKFWNPLRESLKKFENDFKIVFGLSDGHTKAGDTFLGKINTAISKFFGDEKAEGSFFGSIADSFKSGINELWDNIKLFFEERAESAKAAWNSSNPGSLDINGQIERLGNTLVAALGGSNAAANRAIQKEAESSLVEEKTWRNSDASGVKRKALVKDIDVDNAGNFTDIGATTASNIAISKINSKDKEINTSELSYISDRLYDRNRDSDIKVNPSYLTQILGLTTRQIADLIKSGLAEVNKKASETMYLKKGAHEIAAMTESEFKDKVKKGFIRKEDVDNYKKIERSYDDEYVILKKGALNFIENELKTSARFDTLEKIRQLEERVKNYKSSLYNYDKSDITSGLKGPSLEQFNIRKKYEGRKAELDKEYENSEFRETVRNFKELAGNVSEFVTEGVAKAKEFTSNFISGVNTKGIKRNNPGNIRPSNLKGFKEYPTLEDGFKDQLELLRRYITKGHSATKATERLGLTNKPLDSINKILNVWAPTEDSNDTNSYVTAVSKMTGIDPNARIDPNDKNTMMSIAAAMTRVEHGIKGLSREQADSLLTAWNRYSTKYKIDGTSSPQIEQNNTSLNDNKSQVLSTYVEKVSSGDIKLSSNYSVEPKSTSINTATARSSSVPFSNKVDDTINSDYNINIEVLGKKIDTTNKLLAVLVAKPTGEGQGNVTINNETKVYTDKKSNSTENITKPSTPYGSSWG